MGHTAENRSSNVESRSDIEARGRSNSLADPVTSGSGSRGSLMASVRLGAGGLRCSCAAARVEEYQHFFPSNPGARKVHDGQAAASCCFTASAEGRQVKAFASRLANISDAAIQLETHR